jgi:hypothetical protein
MNTTNTPCTTLFFLKYQKALEFEQVQKDLTGTNAVAYSFAASMTAQKGYILMSSANLFSFNVIAPVK